MIDFLLCCVRSTKSRPEFPRLSAMGNNHPQPAGGGGVPPAMQVLPPDYGMDANNNAPRPQPIRDFRPRRFFYSRAQKDRAVRLLNMGIPCRQVARMIGPRCSSGTPIRWRQIQRRQEEARRRLEEMMRNRARF